MTDVYVQFSDGSQTGVVSVFADPQDPAWYPNQAVIQDDDQRYLDFLNPPINILAVNQSQQEVLLIQASQAMAPLLVSLQLGDATEAETETAMAWQAYYRALKLVDLSMDAPDWPTPPSTAEASA